MRFYRPGHRRHGGKAFAHRSDQFLGMAGLSSELPDGAKLQRVRLLSGPTAGHG
jgi:hypothetical protein